MRHVCRDPTEATELERHWLAGLLEGEGSFFKGPPSSPGLPCLQCTMIDRDVIERAAAIIGCGVNRVRPRRSHWKESYALRVRGAPAVAWMKALAPLLGERRRTQIAVAVASYECRSNQVLDDETALEALALLAGGTAVREVAERFGVSQWCIYDLRLGRTHKHVPRPTPHPPAPARPAARCRARAWP